MPRVISTRGTARRPDYHARVGLSLVVGPAHAGKVALLFERYLSLLDRDPWLIVPNQAEVEVVERALVARSGGLLAGTVGTFDRLFESLATSDGRGRPVVGEASRRVLVRRALAEADEQVARRFPGYGEALVDVLAELEGSLLEPEQLADPLREVVRRYREELERNRLWDRGALRRRALERLASELDAWKGSPVLAYGFEDLTSAEWRLLETLSARAEVHVSIPYEPGRPAYASLARTVESLSEIASEVVELPAGSHTYLPASLAHLERSLFDDTTVRAPLDPSIRFLEGAGQRATLELVAEDILSLVRAGAAPEEIGVVCPAVDGYRATMRAVFASAGIPLSIETREPLRSTALGQSLLLLLRFAWGSGERPQLYGHLRSPYSGMPRRDVDWLEGQLRGRGVRTAERTVEVTTELRAGRPLETLALASGDGDAVAIVRRLVEVMVRSAHGLAQPSLSPSARADLRAKDAVVRALDELAEATQPGFGPSRSDVLGVLERVTVRDGRPREPGRVAVLDLRRARTRRFDVVFVLGLEQGVIPRRGRPSPFLDDAERKRLDDIGDARLVRPDAASRDRYLFLTACTRPRQRLTLVREAVSDDGTPREPSPFWDAVRALYDEDDVRRHTVRRALSAHTRELEAAPTERERLRALAVLDVVDREAAGALARANDWERRLQRARTAFVRSNLVTSERAKALLGSREAWSVSDLERMASCSSAWFFERYLRPGPIDRSIDRMLRGSVLHVALQRFYQALPKEIPGAERVTEANVEQAVALVRSCVTQAVATGVRLDVDELERRELESGLQRDLEHLVRQAATWESTYVPRRLEVSFKHELAPGTVISGKIDRVDGDMMSARGMVVDYKSGAASSAADIERKKLLQIPLYMLVLREQLGLEAMGGIYVPIGASKRVRGMLRDEEGESVPGFMKEDYVEPGRFEEMIEEARDTAVGLVERIKQGDIKHDPIGDKCPAWCDLWRMCRKARA